MASRHAGRQRRRAAQHPARGPAGRRPRRPPPAARSSAQWVMLPRSRPATAVRRRSPAGSGRAAAEVGQGGPGTVAHERANSRPPLWTAWRAAPLLGGERVLDGPVGGRLPTATTRGAAGGRRSCDGRVSAPPPPAAPGGTGRIWRAGRAAPAAPLARVAEGDLFEPDAVLLRWCAGCAGGRRRPRPGWYLAVPVGRSGGAAPLGELREAQDPGGLPGQRPVVDQHRRERRGRARPAGAGVGQPRRTPGRAAPGTGPGAAPARRYTRRRCGDA